MSCYVELTLHCTIPTDVGHRGWLIVSVGQSGRDWEDFMTLANLLNVSVCVHAEICGIAYSVFEDLDAFRSKITSQRFRELS